jgi:hypothetical protein
MNSSEDANLPAESLRIIQWSLSKIKKFFVDWPIVARTVSEIYQVDLVIPKILSDGRQCLPVYANRKRGGRSPEFYGNCRSAGGTSRLARNSALPGAYRPALWPQAPSNSLADSRARTAGFFQLCTSANGLRCLEPLGYLDSLCLMDNARPVLTDLEASRRMQSGRGASWRFSRKRFLAPHLRLTSNSDSVLTSEFGLGRSQAGVSPLFQQHAPCTATRAQEPSGSRRSLRNSAEWCD